MGRRLIKVAGGLALVLAVAQLVRPDRTNPPLDPSQTIQAYSGAASGLAPVLDRACGDCHSNATVWPGYARVAPLSWLFAYGVAEGRKAVNFSEWGAYSPVQRQALLGASCRDAVDGKMPGVYTLVRPDTKLSPTDIETICAASRAASASGGR